MLLLMLRKDLISIVNLKISKMKINISLVILKENSDGDFYSLLKYFFSTTDKQTLEIIQYLIDHNFIDRDFELSQYKMNALGYTRLRQYNLLNVSINSIILDTENKDFNYRNKLIKYIPNT